MSSKRLLKPPSEVLDYERQPVPSGIRRNWLEMGIEWFLIAICLPAFMLGAVIGSLYTLTDAFLAILGGSLILTFINIFCGIVGAKTNLSTAFVTRYAFGDYGSIIVAFVLALGAYGWFAVQTGMFGEAVVASFKTGIGLDVNVTAAIIIGGFLMMTTAIYGYRALVLLSKVSAIPLFAAMALGLYEAFQKYSWSELVSMPPPSGQAMPLGFGISIAAGAYMVGAIIGPDITRYARGPKHAAGASVVGFLIGFSVPVFLGAILGYAMKEWDLVKILMGFGWWWFAMITLILAQWTTNDNNLYSAALAFANMIRGEKWPKWKLTIIVGVIGTAIAATGIYGQFVNWLMLLSVLIPPIGGAYVADFYLFHKNMYDYKHIQELPKVRVTSFIAWIVGSAVAFCTSTPPVGLNLFSLTTIPALDSFIIAAVLEIVLVAATRATRGSWPATKPL